MSSLLAQTQRSPIENFLTTVLMKTFTCKNSNFVCFGGFLRQGGDAKMLPTVTFAFKFSAKLWFKDEVIFTLCTADNVQFSVVASITVCRHKGCRPTAILKKNLIENSFYFCVMFSSSKKEKLKMTGFQQGQSWKTR